MHGPEKHPQSQFCIDGEATSRLQADERNTITNWNDHLLKPRVVPNPLIELPNSVTKTTALRLRVVSCREHRVSIVHCVVSNHHCILCEQVALQEQLKVTTILCFVGIDENHVKLLVSGQGRNGIQSGSHYNLMLCGFWKAGCGFLDPIPH